MTIFNRNLSEATKKTHTNRQCLFARRCIVKNRAGNIQFPFRACGHAAGILLRICTPNSILRLRLGGEGGGDVVTCF